MCEFAQLYREQVTAIRTESQYTSPSPHVVNIDCTKEKATKNAVLVKLKDFGGKSKLNSEAKISPTDPTTLRFIAQKHLYVNNITIYNKISLFRATCTLSLSTGRLLSDEITDTRFTVKRTAEDWD